MSLKAYQMPKHCTAVYNIMRENFTVMGSNHGGNYAFVTMIINSRNTVLRCDSAFSHSTKVALNAALG